MTSKKKKLRIAIASMAMTAFLGAGGVGFAIAANANEATWDEISLQQVYQFGDVVEIPDCKMTYGGDEYTALKTVVYPSGTVRNEDSFVAAESGKYTLRYQVNVDGEVLVKEQSFVVMNQMYGFTNSNSTASYGTSAYLPSDVEGLKLSIAKDDVFTFNQVFNVSGMTKEDMICKFYLTPTEKGNGKSETSSLKIMLTDIYDPDNTVTIHYKNTVPTYMHGRVTYTKAAASGQKESGWDWKHSYKGAAKEDYVLEDGRWFDVHTDDTYGLYSGVHSNGNSAGDFIDNYNFFAMDYAKRKVYQQYSWYKTWDEANLVADLDDERVYPDNAWKGFTTGEVILSVWGEGYNAASMNMFITEIAGCDLTKFNFIDTDAPTLTVDYGDYTENTYPSAIVGKPYTVFDATAYDIVDGSADVQTWVYYNYYGSSRALSQITDGKFTPKRAGNYTIVYKATDKMGNEAVECVEITAKTQTAGLSVALGAKTTTATVGNVVTVAGYQAVNATGKTKGSVAAVLKSDETVRYELGEDLQFRPLETGVFAIQYTLSDYIETATESYDLTVEKTAKPLIYEEAVLPRALLKNCTYEFPVIRAYDYSGDTRAEVACELYVSADGANEVKAENGIWQVTAQSTAKLIYKSTNAGGTATKEYVLPVVDGGYNDFGALKMNAYFVGDGFTSTADEEGISYVANKTGEARLSFINKVLLNEFKTSFAFDAANANYSTLCLSLTDIADATAKLDVIFTYADGTLNVKVGNEGETYSLATESTVVDFYYNTNTQSLLINNALEIALANTSFGGFTGKYAYFDFTFKKCNGGVGIEIQRLYTQSFSSTTIDEIAPYIYEANKISSNCTLGEKITLPALEFFDVLDPNVTATVAVYSPKGVIVQTEGGVRLDGKATAKLTHQFTVTEYGAYSVEYKVSDYTGNIKRYSFVLNSCDMDAPTLVFEGEPVTTAKKGAEITLAKTVATDNLSENIKVYAFVYRPDGTIIEVKTGAFTASEVGVYTVYYYTFDEAGNATTLRYQITVS